MQRAIIPNGRLRKTGREAYREIGPLLSGGGANLRTFAMLGGGV